MFSSHAENNTVCESDQRPWLGLRASTSYVGLIRDEMTADTTILDPDELAELTDMATVDDEL